MNKNEIRRVVDSMTIGDVREIVADDEQSAKFLRDLVTNRARVARQPLFYTLSSRNKVFIVNRVETFFPFLKSMGVGDAVVCLPSQEYKLRLSVQYYNKQGMRFLISNNKDGDIVVKKIEESSKDNTNAIERTPYEKWIVTKLDNISPGSSDFIPYKPLHKSDVREIVSAYFKLSNFTYKTMKTFENDTHGIRVWKISKPVYAENLRDHLDAIQKLQPGKSVVIKCSTRKFYNDVLVIVKNMIHRGRDIAVFDESASGKLSLKVVSTAYGSNDSSVESGNVTLKVKTDEQKNSNEAVTSVPVEVDGYLIEDNVPIVVLNKNKQDEFAVVDVLDVGQSFFAAICFADDKAKYNRLHYKLSKVKAKTGKAFITNSREEKGIKGIRVWRLK